MKRGRGGVQYEDLLLGVGASAAHGSLVNIRYDLRLNRGETLQRNVLQSFRIGERRVVAGLEYGIQGMKVGGKRRIRVGPHLGYREDGVPGIVPPNAVLEFEVALLSVS